MKKIAIIGGGVAGITAAIYALRANAEVTMFEQFGLGGLVATIDKIENYPSYKSVEGFQLASDMAAQAKALGLKVIRRRVVSLTKDGDEFVVTTDKEQYTFPSVVVATGTSHNKLGIEDAYVGKGVSYCATCDGNFYRGRPVAVVGGGNAAVKEALYLADLCSVVQVIVPKQTLSAEDVAVANLLAKSNVTIHYGATVAEICGDGLVSSIKVFADGSMSELAVDAVFVAIGARPVTDFILVDGLQLKNGYLAVDSRCETSVKGLFACGDVTDGTLKQIVTACADGAKAGAFASAFAATVKQ